MPNTRLLTSQQARDAMQAARQDVSMFADVQDVGVALWGQGHELRVILATRPEDASELPVTIDGLHVRYHMADAARIT